MSKKLAEGSTALVLDVEVRRAARSCRTTGRCARAGAGAGVDRHRGGRLRTEAFITRMDTPLGRAVGNSVEIAECIDVLSGRGSGGSDGAHRHARRRAWCCLAARPRAKRTPRQKVRDALRVRRRARQTAADDHVAGRRCRRRRRYRPAAERRARTIVTATTAAATCQSLDALLVGRTAVALGAGRDKKGDPVDLSAGILLHKKPGEPVAAGEPIMELRYNDESRLKRAMALATQAAVHRRHSRRRARRWSSGGCTTTGEQMFVDGSDADEVACGHIDAAPTVGRAASASSGSRSALSTNRRAINLRVVGWGLGLQVLFALIVVKTDVGHRRPLRGSATKIQQLLAFSVEGSRVRVRPARRRRGSGRSVMNSALGA